VQAVAAPHNLIQIVSVGGLTLLVIMFRLRRMAQSRRLQVERLWIVPTIFAIIAALTFVQTPPHLSDAPWLAGIALLGAMVGWYRGKMMRITIDPQTHALNQSASPAALLFLLAVFAFRYGVRFALAAEAPVWGISVNLLADGPLLFAVAMLAVQRLEMFVRARRLLREARAAHTTAPVTSEPGG